MARKRRPKLVDPQSAHSAVTLQLLGVPSGRDRTLADQRARMAEPGSDRPKDVTGNLDDGTWANDLLNVLQGRGIVVNKAVRGGQFGQQLHNAALVNADSPIVQFYAQSSSDGPPTTNTATTVSAATESVILGVGKWAVILIVTIGLSHSTSGTVAVSAEIEGNEGTARTYSAAATPGVRAFAHLSLVDESDWIDGEQTLNVRARFRSDTAGTTTAKNPALICVAKRME